MCEVKVYLALHILKKEKDMGENKVKFSTNVNERVCALSKCPNKKEKINLETDNFILIRNKNRNEIYHPECWCKRVISYRDKSKRLSEEQAIELMPKMIEDSKRQMSNYFQEIKKKDDLFRFLAKNYGAMSFSSWFYIKFNDVFNGTRKGLFCVIPPEHLLEMWRRQMQTLNKIYTNNVSKGKSMTPEQRVLYDLTILVNHYDDFLHFKEQQQAINNENNKYKQEEDLSKYINLNNKNHFNNQGDDIGDILDELI